MSYDVWIGDESFNYTSNVYKMFSDHIDGGLTALDGLTGKQAVERLSTCFLEIDRSRVAESDKEFRDLYDAPNGWGSALGGIIFLARIMAACATHPRKTLRVSA